MNPYRIGRGPDYQRPPQVSYGSGNHATAEHRENKRRKASKEAAETVKRETHTRKGGYLKYRNNNLKGKRAGRLDRAKECRHTVPTENKVERE